MTATKKKYQARNVRLKPGRRSLAENLPQKMSGADENRIPPSHKAAQHFLYMVGRSEALVTLAENRLAALGETRAALLCKLMDDGFADLPVEQLKTVSRWHLEKNPARTCVDAFIASQKLRADKVYLMLKNSLAQMKRKDAALFGEGMPSTIRQIFECAQAAEEKRLGIVGA